MEERLRLNGARELGFCYRVLSPSSVSLVPECWAEEKVVLEEPGVLPRSELPPKERRANASQKQRH